MPIQVRGVLVHAMSGTELSRVRTEFRLRLPEPINKSPLESRGPTLLCNQVKYWNFSGKPTYHRRRTSSQKIVAPAAPGARFECITFYSKRLSCYPGCFFTR